MTSFKGAPIEGETCLLWLVLASTSERGDYEEVSCHFTEGDANIAAKGKGWWGSDGKVEQRFGMKTYDGEYFLITKVIPLEITVQERENIRKEAMGKLTTLEREVLGLK